jgi:hypothetical protein
VQPPSTDVHQASRWRKPGRFAADADVLVEGAGRRKPDEQTKEHEKGCPRSAARS